MLRQAHRRRALPAGMPPGSPFSAPASPRWRSICTPATWSATTSLVEMFKGLFGLEISEGADRQDIQPRERAVCRGSRVHRCRSPRRGRRSPPMRHRRASKARPAGSGCLARPRRWRTASRPAAARRWSANSLRAPRRKSGSATALAHNERRQERIKSASPISCATARYAIEAGDKLFAPGFKSLLKRAFAIGRRRESLADGTLQAYRRDLERRLGCLLAVEPDTEAGLKLRRGIEKCRDKLFVFVTRRDVPPTSNTSERRLRPSVIFRKVTNGFRSAWGATAYAAICSVIETGMLRGKTAFAAIRICLAGVSVLAAH